LKTALTILLLFFSTILLGQNKYWSFGLKKNGICFGNSSYFNGLRFNFIDENVIKYNGINLSLATNSQLTNGVSFGLLSSTHELFNGFNISGIFSSGNYNGILVTGLWSMTSKINGISISGINTGDTLNGLILGYWTVYGDKEINGVALGTFYVHSKKMNGLSFALLKNEFSIQKGLSISFFNDSKELHGVQLGLLNHAENNRRMFRWSPFINFNLRKNATK